jgi:4'-phosphopantetheinyl transferase
MDVSVRFFDLDGVSVDEALLAHDERGRVARKATPVLRQRQAASFHVLRVTLGEVLAVEPRALAFHRSASGKPELLGAALHFNLSHSGGLGMLAWGPRALGADVETLIARPSARLAGKILAPREFESWRALPERDRQAWLTRAWTRKESVLKAMGSGLRIPPRAIDVMSAERGANAASDSAHAWGLELAGRCWAGVDWLDGIGEGCRAAVCVAAR